MNPIAAFIIVFGNIAAISAVMWADKRYRLTIAQVVGLSILGGVVNGVIASLFL